MRELVANEKIREAISEILGKRDPNDQTMPSGGLVSEKRVEIDGMTVTVRRVRVA